MKSFKLIVSLVATLLYVGTPLLAQDGSPSPEGAPQPRGEKIVLKLNLPKGTKKAIGYNMDMTMNMTVPGQGAQQMLMAMGFEIGMEVTDAKASGEHTMDMTYDRVKMNVNAGPVQMAYDSADKNAQQNPLAQQMGALVGKTITATVSPEGKVKDVKGLDKLGPPQQVEQMKQTMEQMFNMYPPKPVDIGDSWTEKRDMAAAPGMNMKADVTYTLIDRKAGNAIVKIDGKFDAAGQVQLKGTMKGTVSINEKTGWTESGAMTMSMEGNQGGIPLEMKAKIGIDGNHKSKEAE